MEGVCKSVGVILAVFDGDQSPEESGGTSQIRPYEDTDNMEIAYEDGQKLGSDRCQTIGTLDM